MNTHVFLVHQTLAEANAYGRAKSVSREDLCFVLNIGDRKLRALIEEERKRGAVILSGSATSGYYLPADQEEIKAYINDTISRITALEENLKGARSLLKTMQSQACQPELF